LRTLEDVEDALADEADLGRPHTADLVDQAYRLIKDLHHRLDQAPEEHTT
jgi:hypothetical protein